MQSQSTREGQGPQGSYGAILLDLDGTLVNSEGHVHPETLEALREASDRGVVVMVATGRSTIATMPVLDVLDLPTPAVVFNGAGIYCRTQGRMLEERLLSERIMDQVHDYLERSGDLAVFMCALEKFSRKPNSDAEVAALAGLHKIQELEPNSLRGIENVMRVTFLSSRHKDSHEYHGELEEAIKGPSYRTHFSLSLLPRYADSPYQVADVHPPCLGKAEALRYLEETYGIPAARVVAVGDAYNDYPMVQAAGLGVCMGNGVAGLQRRADRVIGDNEGTAIAELVRELFLSQRV